MSKAASDLAVLMKLLGVALVMDCIDTKEWSSQDIIDAAREATKADE